MKLKDIALNKKNFLGSLNCDDNGIKYREQMFAISDFFTNEKEPYRTYFFNENKELMTILMVNPQFVVYKENNVDEKNNASGWYIIENQDYILKEIKNNSIEVVVHKEQFKYLISLLKDRINSYHDQYYDNEINDIYSFPRDTDNIEKTLEYWLKKNYKSSSIIKNEINVIFDTLVKKNKDYGCSVFTVPSLCEEINVREAILVRLSDKKSRYLSLLDYKRKRIDPNFESIEDTIRDIIGYYILLWCFDNKELYGI